MGEELFNSDFAAFVFREPQLVKGRSSILSFRGLVTSETSFVFRIAPTEWALSGSHTGATKVTVALGNRILDHIPGAL